MAILEMGSCSSYCSECRGGAHPNQTGHYESIGYGVEPGTKGCGEEWTGVVFTYSYPGMVEAHMKIGRWSYQGLIGLPIYDWDRETVLGIYGSQE